MLPLHWGRKHQVELKDGSYQDRGSGICGLTRKKQERPGMPRQLIFAHSVSSGETAEGFGALKCDQRASLGDESFGDIWDRSEKVKQSQ